MRILLVEDNRGDQVIMQEAFQEAKVPCELDLVKDGVEAVEFLKREGQFKNAGRPDLIILDLNLPRKNGHEVLAEIKQHPTLKHIPVIVLSNSCSPNDVCDSYELRANIYIRKPSGFQGFVDFAHMIGTFWIKLACYCTH